MVKLDSFGMYNLPLILRMPSVKSYEYEQDGPNCLKDYFWNCPMEIPGRISRYTLKNTTKMLGFIRDNFRNSASYCSGDYFLNLSRDSYISSSCGIPRNYLRNSIRDASRDFTRSSIENYFRNVSRLSSNKILLEFN